MTDYSPQPRRRRPSAETVPAPEPAPPVDLAEVVPSAARPAKDSADQAEAPAPKRRRRASVGGFHQKLGAPSRPGFTRRWFNDSGNRIAEADELGYTPVSEQGLKSSRPGSQVSRLVDTQANGEPLHAILMETPDELYAEGVAEREAVARSVDEAINRGEGTLDGHMSEIPTDQRYGQGSISKPDR